MQIDRVILSANEYPAYLQYWPMVAGAWHKILGIKPDLAYVTDQRPEYFRDMQEWGTVHKFDPIPGMPSSNQAKISRLILAARYPNAVCMLSDLDMMPLSGEPFWQIEAALKRNRFVCHGADAFDHVDLEKEQAHGIVPICYIAAEGFMFGKLYGPNDYSRVKEWTHLRANPWVEDFSDEAMIRHLGIMNAAIPLERKWNGTAWRRIDRAAWEFDPVLLKQGWYWDAHLPRIATPVHRLDLLMASLE
jgi:hypothetical protein